MKRIIFFSFLFLVFLGSIFFYQKIMGYIHPYTFYWGVAQTFAGLFIFDFGCYLMIALSKDVDLPAKNKNKILVITGIFALAVVYLVEYFVFQMSFLSIIFQCIVIVFFGLIVIFWKNYFFKVK